MNIERYKSADTQRPLRIAHVITRLINGGADENTVLSCNHAVQAGHDVILVHGAESRSEILAKVDARVKIIAVPSLVRPIAPRSDMKTLRDVAQIFRRFGPDVVHTHTSKAGILGRLAARATNVPVIVHGVHVVPFVNVGPFKTFVYMAAERVVQRLTHAFIDVGSGVRDLCVNKGVGTPERHHVIHSGFDLSRFRNAEPPNNWRDLLRLQSDDPRPLVLLMIASFEARKRHLEFLARFTTIVTRFPDVRLILAGDGKLRNAIDARIEMLRLERNVILTGFHQHPEQLIALADICLLTSIREGLPRVVVQSLAGGKPVVATNLPGLEEVLWHDVNGLITPSDDLDALAEAIVALLEDDTRRARLARGAAATDLSAWDAEKMAERIESVYSDVIAARHASLRRLSQEATAPSLPRAEGKATP